MGADSLDDAGIYKINDTVALVQTLDFFTPVVEDPYIFGQIAVTNALSDVYAMGGEPITAMNIVSFPSSKMDMSVLNNMLKGGMDKLREAGVPLLGGHSLIDKTEVKYGLSVTGQVHPDKILSNSSVEIGDKLILTKPIGTGILNNCLKNNILDNETKQEIIKAMTMLNKLPSEIAIEVGVNACTDITGFGLTGHLLEMINPKNLGMKLSYSSIPKFSRVEEFSENGVNPPGNQRNIEANWDKLNVISEIPDWKLRILFDAQTAGGLLFSVSPEKADTLLNKLHENGIKDATIIGEIIEEPKRKITIMS